jgi:anaerobic selenocysteine-containing dehydrogenase
VLPAASFLEFDDLVVSYFNYSVSAQVKAMEPIGESLPNQEIFRKLAAAMGFGEPELYESDGEILATLLRQTGLPLDFATLARAGTVDYSPEPVIQFVGLRFPTPSGKIEIASDRFVAEGQSRAPWPRAEARPGAGRLRLLSPASRWLMNSSYHNVTKNRAGSGPADVLLHPAEAAARGLVGGMAVLLSNETGQLPLRVALSDTVPRGVALVHKGRWPKLDPSGANVNVLNPGTKADLAESCAVHSIEVEIRPID